MKELTLLAYGYAPFFFAVLFTIFITKRAYGHYRSAPPSSQQAKIFGWVFIGTHIISLFLVIATSIWWFMNSPTYHLFEGKITGLNSYEKIASEVLYFRSYTPSLQSGDKPIPIREEHFLIARDRPFGDTEEFDFYFQKGESSYPERLTIKYQLGQKSYKVVYDVENDKYVLELNSPEESASSTSILESMLFQNAYAQGAQNDPIGNNLGPLASRVKRHVIEALQSERTDVGTKVDFLQMLRKETDESLEEYLKFVTAKESMALTILDLSRHTDVQLAGISRNLLNRFDLPSYVVDELRSDDDQRLENVSKLLYRIEDSRRESLRVTAASSSVVFPTGRNPRVLIPTGSPQGDRYYVRASWSILQDNMDRGLPVVECLTRLFNEELITDRTLEKERKLMEQLKGNRFVYWYSKSWALSIAKKIEDCGGESAFVNGITFKVPSTP